MSEKTINKVPNVPNLRFFNDVNTWSNSSLEKKCKFVGGGTPSTLNQDYWNGDIAWISSADLLEENVHKYNVSRFITKEAIMNSATKICPINTIMIVSRVGVGKIAISNSEICTSQDFTNLTEYQFDKNFLVYSLKNTIEKLKNSSQGTSIKGITSKEIKQINIFYPEIIEQCKIGLFFKKIDERIEFQSKIINKLESLICTLRSTIFNSYNWEWNRLDTYIKSGIITLKRGNVIPKHDEDSEFKFPVYSSSIHNNGLMGYNNSYMFDKELITWSVDGGGNFFYRPKHKFNVTNVCGIMEITDNSYNYRFLSEILLAQHSRLIFDYQTKAHPSVIDKLYKIPNVDIKIQEKIAYIFELYYTKLQKEKDILSLYKKQKAYLLQNMFI